MVNAYAAIASLFPYINYPGYPTVSCSNTTVSLSAIPNIAPLLTNIVWSSSDLDIVSGQGTQTVTIRKKTTSPAVGTLLYADLYFNGGSKITRQAWIPLQPTVIDEIEASSDSTYPGGSINFYASPVSSGTYDWRVTPSTGTQINSSTRYCTVSFQNSGSYTVECRFITNCGNGPWTGVQVQVN